MVLVREGEIALTWNGDQPELLGPGRHILFKPTNHVLSVLPLSAPLIHHGPLYLIRVKVGEIAHGIDTVTGKPVLLPPGQHFINSPTFVFNRIIASSEEDIDLNPYRLIRVNTGNIGFVYRQGELQILETGRLHLILPTDKFGGFLSLQQDVIALPEKPYDNCDYVPLIIKADVFYEIADPRLTIRRISGNRDAIRKYIMESAVATLASIIRGSSLADIAQSADPSYSNKQPVNEEGLAGQSFQSTVHDQFMSVLATYFKDEFGIQLNNIRIESLALQDSSMRQQLAGQAATSVQNQSALKNVENKRKLQEAEILMDIAKKTGEVKAVKDSEQIAVEVDGSNLLRKAKAEAEAKTIAAKAAADAAFIQAEAEARSITVVGKAKAESEALMIRMRGEAEASSAEMLDRTQLGPRLALAQVQAESLKNIEKIMYLPSGQQGDLPSLLTTIGLFQPR
eukprot:NODE_1852_length_1783_cov_50.875904_g1571_i0.p1 GENE.NODE_1852_length_1783_cov_50.875904_g1571_i0~~NODE_1852_length_1783_cov_50.875904_g1571_i0.p1  ORF type:complete len:527 (+),score=113.36 NODE_1852_length_1783_cov_50.875904_g1571_i0:222-1583(+)